MIEFEAAYYDGMTSQRRDVRAHFEAPNWLRLSGLEREVRYELSKVRVSARIANTARHLYLPDGGKCETTDNDAVDAMLRMHGRGRGQAFLNLLESKLRYVFLLLAVTILGFWAFIEYGIPALAKRAAFSLPASADASLGRDGLRIMDQLFFSGTEIEEPRREQLRALFDGMMLDLDEAPEMHLEFRKGGDIGANAFALPSGIVIVTDEFVDLAENEDEIIAVLAHEVGHVVYRHTLRSLLQNSATVLIVATFTGDIASITALSSALPTLLLEAKYSREFETEADDYALEYLLAHDISPDHFADILVRLDEAIGSEQATNSFLSTHPATEERVERFREAAEQR